MTESILVAEHISKSYGPVAAVRDLSLEVRRGQVFGFLGPNGAGKTTAIGMMCGLLRPDAGRVTVCGMPVTGAGAGVRTRVGVCPQDALLWGKLTCLEQLEFLGAMYGVRRAVARTRAKALLAALGLAEKSGSPASTLSGGMKRRLNLALALIHDPPIVVLDEPEAGLDPQSRVMVREYIRALAPEKTVILTTHNMDEADRLADRLAIIDHGSLLVTDSPAALKHRLGGGDVVEIRVEAAAGGPVDGGKACAALEPFSVEARFFTDPDLLRVRAPDAVSRLASFIGALARAGLRPGEVAIRPNTLEDVFLQLTGRRLRE